MLTLTVGITGFCIVILLVLTVGALARVNLTLTAMLHKSRPYIVDLMAGGARHVERVDAYDLMEAMMTATVRVTALGVKDVTVINVRPDPDARERAIHAELPR